MRSRDRLLYTVIGFALILFVTPVHAHDDGVPRHRHPALKHRIVELQNELAQMRAETNAAITQLRSVIDYQTREDGAGASPGWGGGTIGLCDDPCATDSDGDGLGDCEDPCPCDASTNDRDGDSVTDCLDPCPDDATDACIDPCRWDTDVDGLNDCEDPCPWDPAAAIDDDGDGIVNCQDACPNDPNDACYDWCRLDQDGDGVADCKDPCPWTVEANGGVVCEVPPMAILAGKR